MRVAVSALLSTPVSVSGSARGGVAGAAGGREGAERVVSSHGGMAERQALIVDKVRPSEV